ncbi:TIGR00659 family protein [Halopseudomonas xinjiangensis]|uniref:TIGR00659 family protein n=1 Tax=Halopseudomonas xinjiangensis TaxID=487184 RepID=A0A1H1YX91_9GAMM|nr:LrgB family protein [Halopseudomonas xinjiangensis]SDT26018.1 TIGR00659 family protein [Halopseudomonas xinjiangensis]
MSDLLQIGWLAIIEHPLFFIGLTLVAYQLSLVVYERTRLPLLHPVLGSIAILVVVLWLLDVQFPTYRDAVGPLLVLLGPATVALAVPLYLNLRRIRQFFWPILITLLVAGVFATVSVIALGWLLGASPAVLMTLAPKSVTTPIAMLVAEQIGGIAALVAVFVMFTGVLGAVIGPWLLSRCGVSHPAARGMAMGLTAHAVGTARSLEESEEAGAFSALAMSLMGIATAVLLPLAVAAWYWLGG